MPHRISSKRSPIWFWHDRREPETTFTSIATIILFLSLGLDTLGVAIGLGLTGLGGRERVRFALAFALAEGIMPLIGFVAGQGIARVAGNIAAYIAIAALFAIGVYTLWESFGEGEREFNAETPWKLLLLAISVSLDELAVGFSLGLLHVAIVLAVVYIAVQAFVVTMVGTAVGARLGERIGEQSERVAGAALTGLACFLLAQKLLDY
ncbi:MAG: manganese efflux pump MntP family protein [Chloroflexota bacterium]